MAETETYRMIRGGWTLLIDGLKTYLETGQPLEFPEEEERRKGRKGRKGGRQWRKAAVSRARRDALAPPLHHRAHINAAVWR